MAESGEALSSSEGKKTKLHSKAAGQVVPGCARVVLGW